MGLLIEIRDLIEGNPRILFTNDSPGFGRCRKCRVEVRGTEAFPVNRNGYTNVAQRTRMRDTSQHCRVITLNGVDGGIPYT